MNIAISNITGLRNRGVEALVVPTIEYLKLRQPNWEVNIVTNTPEYDASRLQNYTGVNLIDRKSSNPRQSNSRRSQLRKLLTKVSPLHKSSAPEQPLNISTLREASVVIASGGDLFTSDYGFLDYNLKPLRVALEANVPVVFLAQSIGPFKTDEEAEAWVAVARKSKLVTVREQLSYNYVTKDLGLSTNLVKHTADPAFLLTPPPSQEVERLLRYYGINQDRPVVALAASQGISWFGNCDAHKHLEVLYQVVNMLIQELDVQVLLIPHVQEIKSHLDDRIIANKLLRLLNFDPRVRLASLDHSASEFKGLIGACDLVIAERMHAAIAGLSSGVCPVAVGYSVKAEGIMTDLLGVDSLYKELLISIQDFLDADAALAVIRNAWGRRQEVATRLNQILPQVKKDAEANYDLISQILSDVGNNMAA